MGSEKLNEQKTPESSDANQSGGDSFLQNNMRSHVYNRGSLVVPDDAVILFSEPGIRYRVKSNTLINQLTDAVTQSCSQRMLFASPPMLAKSDYRWSKQEVEQEHIYEGVSAIRVPQAIGESAMFLVHTLKPSEKIIARPYVYSTTVSHPSPLFQVVAVSHGGSEVHRGPESTRSLKVDQDGYVYAEDLELGNEKFVPFKTDEALFKILPTPHDIRQSWMGDCFLLSSIAAILNTPDGSDYIMSIMKQCDDGTTIVRLFDPRSGQPVYVRVNNSYHYKNGKSTVNHTQPWVHILEKAYAGLAFREINTGEHTIEFPSFELMYGEGGRTDLSLKILTGKVRETKRVTIDNSKISPIDIKEWAVLLCLASKFFASPEVPNDVIEMQIALIRENCKLLSEMLESDETIISFAKYLTNWSMLSEIEKISDAFVAGETVEKIIKKLDALNPPLPVEVSRAFKAKFQQVEKKEGISIHQLAGPIGSGEYTRAQYKLFKKLQLLSKDHAITASTHTTFGINDAAEGLVSQHAYAIDRVYVNDKNRLYIGVRNPWGYEGRRYEDRIPPVDSDDLISRASYKKGVREKSYATSTLDLTDFMSHFQSYSAAPVPCVVKQSLALIEKPAEPQVVAAPSFWQLHKRKIFGALGWLAVIGAGVGVAIATCGVSLLVMGAGAAIGFVVGSGVFKGGCMLDKKNNASAPETTQKYPDVSVGLDEPLLGETRKRRSSSAVIATSFAETRNVVLADSSATINASMQAEAKEEAMDSDYVLAHETADVPHALPIRRPMRGAA
jgi:hypothetical protein